MFWRINSRAFESSFYLRGYAGWALRLAQWVFAATRTTDAIQAFCSVDSLAQQQDIWTNRIKPVLLNPVVVALLKNPVFCWNALGVPMAQRTMFLNEGSAFEYIRDTFEPLASHAVLKTGAYHYLLTLLGHYTPQSCPEYLTKHGYTTLRANGGTPLDAFRLHTDSIVKWVSFLAFSCLTAYAVLQQCAAWPAQRRAQHGHHHGPHGLVYARLHRDRGRGITPASRVEVGWKGALQVRGQATLVYRRVSSSREGLSPYTSDAFQFLASWVCCYNSFHSRRAEQGN